MPIQRNLCIEIHSAILTSAFKRQRLNGLRVSEWARQSLSCRYTFEWIKRQYIEEDEDDCTHCFAISRNKLEVGAKPGIMMTKVDTKFSCDWQCTMLGCDSNYYLASGVFSVVVVFTCCWLVCSVESCSSWLKWRSTWQGAARGTGRGKRWKCK